LNHLAMHSNSDQLVAQRRITLNRTSLVYYIS